MFAEKFRCAAMAAPRERLDEVTAALWQAFAAGGVTEAEAGEVVALVQSRRALPPGPAARRPRVVRPRPPEDLERRRRMVASGWMPPGIAGHFTQGEAAAMAVVAREISLRGGCGLCHDRIADLAGVGKTTVRNAMRHAKRLGLVAVEERRLTSRRNAPNLVRIVSPEWTAWLRLASRRPSAQGVKTWRGLHTQEVIGLHRKGAPRGKGLPAGRLGEPAEAILRKSRTAAP